MTRPRDYPVDGIRWTGRVSVPAQAADLAVKLQAGATVPAVWLDAGGVLVDGHHRLAAHIAAGLSTIKAHVLSDAQDDAFENLLDDGIDMLCAYGAIIGATSPRNHDIRW